MSESHSLDPMPARRIFLLGAGIVLLALISVSLALPGEPSRYFPDRGRGALHQRELDLKTPATVMMLAGEPGEEDLTTMTTLRMESGARVVVVYLTNGEGTLADDRDDIPSVNAGRRKVEAFQATALIDCESFFLNIPDVSVETPSRSPAEMWASEPPNADLTDAIGRFKPDVILIPRPLREADTARTQFLLRASLEACRAVQEGGGEKILPPWRVRRVFAEGDSASGMTRVNAGRLHPYLKRTYFSIAGEARGAYTSLRLRLRGCKASAVHWYKQIAPAGGTSARSLLAGEPRISSDLDPVKGAVDVAVRLAQGNDRKNCRIAVAEALARIEKLLLVKRDRLDALTLRILARWNECLESLRCSVDDISADIVQSDSIMADRQLFYLRVNAVHLPSPVKETEILFPTAGDTTWVINESRQNHFPLTVPGEWRVLTPSRLPLNYPPSLSGIGSSEMRVTVPYFIYHKDPDRARNFAYRRELSLKVGPGRAFEVLTPVVRMTPGEEVRFRVFNVTRQGLKSEAQVKDSVIADSRASIVLDRKDQITLCTIPLHFQNPIPGSDHLAEIRIGRQSGGRFLVRDIECRVDSVATLALASGIPDGIITTSLRRLHIPSLMLDSAALRARAWDTCAAIILDRNALALRSDIRDLMGDVRAWVVRGGRLIVFPQHESGGMADRAFPEFRFEDDLMPSQDSVQMLDEHFGLSPNRLTATDWQNWLVSRSTDRIVLDSTVNAAVIARSTKSQAALVLRIPSGKGSITVVALDLCHQLETLHAGACRIFANLLAR